MDRYGDTACGNVLDDPDDGSADPSRRLTIDIQFHDDCWQNIGDVKQRIAGVSAALARQNVCDRNLPATATIVLANDDFVRTLNARFRGKDAATNVLAFPTAEFHRQAGQQERLLGDVVLAFDTMRSEAIELGIEPAHHVQHLVVHGLLHLLGFDHLGDEDAAIMEDLEIRVLAELGIANPYLADVLDDQNVRERDE